MNKTNLQRTNTFVIFHNFAYYALTQTLTLQNKMFQKCPLNLKETFETLNFKFKFWAQKSFLSSCSAVVVYSTNFCQELESHIRRKLGRHLSRAGLPSFILYFPTAQSLYFLFPKENIFSFLSHGWNNFWSIGFPLTKDNLRGEWEGEVRDTNLGDIM